MRVDQSYRGVLARSREQGSVVILHVDSHDDAYAWARRHRARLTDGKILFLTFTANLAADLQRSLKELITHDEDFKRVEVVHLDQWFTGS